MSDSNPKSPLITVVLPVFNAENTIRMTLDSVLTQSYSKLEVLVVDDCSTDSSAAIVGEYSARDDRVRIMLLTRNSGGPAEPRNMGIEEAKGEYVCFIDSDDLWHPRKIELQLQLMQRLKLRFLSTRAKKVYQNEGFELLLDEQLAEPFDLKTSPVGFSSLLKKNWIVLSSVMVEREIITKHKFPLDARFVEDYACWLLIHRRENLTSFIIEKPLVAYCIRQGSHSRNKLRIAQRIWWLLSQQGITGGLSLWQRIGYFSSYVFHGIFRPIYLKA